MQGNFIMLQKEDLKEAIAEVLEMMVGKNLLKEPVSTASTEYLTRNELCAHLHITYTTLWRMEKRGDIQVHKIGRHNLYSKQEVDALISKGLPTNANNQ
ncbi:helix-turn-helix domain-containing protein [Prevotella melaninogenica]|uniref:helix-turn-helix transcriptional regulator n=1 Tax=Prevotella TaxID=838 RepID=UPI0003AD5597|nr:MULTISPECIES: helix-turn-helix domain-containing protein [Prevotella]ERJ74955.1 DNA binding domain, excisionase family [Prevotella sp. F0091]QUB73250.1 helix-turn-helix domain-containing protein [Prevotella melaninogenica]